MNSSPLKPWIAGTVACLLATAPSPLAATAPDRTVETLEGLVAEWVDLRAQIAQEQREWEQNEAHWTVEIGLLKKERAALAHEIGSATEFEKAGKQDRLSLLARKEKLEAVIDGIEPLLDRAEIELRAWEDLLPPALAAPLRSAFLEIPKTHSDAGSKSLGRRVQLVLGLYTQVEALEHAFHVTREILPTGEGRKQEVDVLYLGLARGFAVSRGNGWAAVGTPGRQGWHWAPEPAIARDVRKAVEVLNRERTADWISLPLQLSEVEE